MIEVFIYKRQKPLGYLLKDIVQVKTESEANEIINSYANHPYAFATTTPFNVRKTSYRKSYTKTTTASTRSAAEYIKTLNLKKY